FNLSHLHLIGSAIHLADQGGTSHVAFSAMERLRNRDPASDRSVSVCFVCTRKSGAQAILDIGDADARCSIDPGGPNSRAGGSVGDRARRSDGWATGERRHGRILDLYK